MGNFSVESMSVSNGRLVVRTSPGARFFEREGENRFRVGIAVLGGNGSSSCSAAEVADFLAQRLKHVDLSGLPEGRENPLSLLRELGWDDVAEMLRELNAREHSLEARISRLKAEIESRRAFYDQHRDHSVDWWAKALHDQAVSAPDFDPDDYSPRRTLWAAQSSVQYIREFEESLAELAELEAQARAKESAGENT